MWHLGSCQIKGALTSRKPRNLSWQWKDKSLRSQTSYIKFEDMLFEITVSTIISLEKTREWHQEAETGCAEVAPQYMSKISPEYQSPLSAASLNSLFSWGCTADTKYGYPIAVKGLTLVQSLGITARTLSGPAEFKGAAETPTVPAVIHYSLRLTCH